MNKVATRIKILRKRRGLTQEQLAARAGCTRPYLARIEAAQHEPTLTMLGKLARALRVRPAAFFE